MTNPNSNPWDLGGGGESFPFDHIGDEIEGYVQEMSERQGTDMQTGEPDWWDEAKTRPKMLTILTLQTNLRTAPEDDGMRTVTLSGSKKPETKSRMAAALAAVKAATGGSQMQFNAWFKMKYVADGPRTKPGFNPPKYYEAWYRPPVMDLDGNSQPSSPASQMSQPQPGANWPSAQSSSGPEWAQSSSVPEAASNPPASAAAGGAAITAAQIAGLRAAGVDPALVYGADWESRVVA